MDKKFNVGIIGAGQPPAEIEHLYPKYSTLIGEQLAALNPTIVPVPYNLWDGEFPKSVDECDAWVISGSKYGVYERDTVEWIPPLEKLIVNAFERKMPVVGICFGHQIMAQALGGKVVKSDKGWSLGNTEYQWVSPPAWMHGADTQFSIQAYHQDQITEMPKGARVLASSDFCPIAGLLWEDNKAVSLQGHPEFDSQYMRALLDLRSADMPNDAITQAAYQHVDDGNSRGDIMQWLADFIVANVS